MISGEKFGRYEIRKKIGSGGMGEVYLAQDLELDRPVALKLLPEEFYNDAERVQRFKQEARAASALNHPNIITIYEIGETDKRIFIATEYIDGDTLRQKIEKNEISMFDAVHIAEQVASALAVAHHSHIVHRDIKPENIMLRADGYVKILDFGLAKPAFKTAGTEDKTLLQMVHTQAGMVMGSVSYMSPEQARGKEVDGRTDIWSLGVVLYEMITGKNPFAGETVSDSLAAVIHIEPDPLDKFVEDAPEDLQWIIRKSLEKKPIERYQSIKDLSLDLKDLRYQFEHGDLENRTRQVHAYSRSGDFTNLDTKENKTLIHQTVSADNTAVKNSGHVSSPQVQTTTTAPRKGWIIPVASFSIAALLFLGAWYTQTFSVKDGAPRFDSVQISRVTENGRASKPVISTDGKYVAYVNSDNGLLGLVVRQVTTGSTVQIVPPSNLGFQTPTFSPDGSYVYYTQIDNAVGTLYQVPTLGGAPKKIIVDVDSKVTFSPDGKRLAFIRNDIDKSSSNIYLVNSDGTNPELLVSTEVVNEKRFAELAWSPDNEHILISSPIKFFRDDLFETKLLTVSVKDKSIRQVGDKTWLTAGSFNWSKDGSGFYFISKTNEADPKQIWFLSYPEAEAKQLTNDSSGYATMSYSADSSAIIASKVDVISSIWAFNPQSREMTQVTTESKSLQGAGGVTQMSDGRILFTKVEGNQGNLAVMDEDGRNETTLITGGVNAQATLSPDGKFIVFSSNRDGHWQIWRAGADGKNPVKLSSSFAIGDFRPLVLGDNKTVIFERKFDEIFKSKLIKVSIEGGAEEQLFSDSPTSDSLPRLSADGKHLSYVAQTFDTKTLNLQSSLKFVNVEGGRIGVSDKEINQNFGYNYRWMKDNKSLVYINSQGVPNLFNLPMDGSKPKQLTNFSSGVILNFDYSSDGKRIYLVRGIINSDLILIKYGTNATLSKNNKSVADKRMIS